MFLIRNEMKTRKIKFAKRFGQPLQIPALHRTVDMDELNNLHLPLGKSHLGNQNIF